MTAPEPALHGRDPSLRTLRGALEDALRGHGRLALVSGEAGIGKSALVAALAPEAEARGAEVTWGRAWEFAGAPPYFPLWPCLRPLGIAASRDDSTFDDGREFQLWESVVGALARASGTTPLVWILEDLHAADLATLDLLSFLAQPLRTMRVLVVATLRDRDPRLTDRMTQRLTRMGRDGIEVSLGRLSEDEIARLTGEILGREVDPRARKRLADLTGGNPLFVIECARAFRAAGGVEGTLGSLPPTVQNVVLDRISLLPEATRRALARGAVLGRELSAATVARMNDTLPAQVIDALLPALRAGVIEETRPGQFCFSHVLVRDAIEAALPTLERAEIHRRAEVALAALGETADVLLERARHALGALGTSGAERTIDLATRAIALLEREGAFDRAFELGMRLEESRVAGFLPPSSLEEKLHTASVARSAGRADVCRRFCDEIVASARLAGASEILARTALLQTADVRPIMSDRAQIALLEEALSGLGDRAPGLAARVQARLATALQPNVDPGVPLETARTALARARETNDPAVILDVLELGGWGLYYAPLEEFIAWSTELLDRALRAKDVPKALTAHAWLVFHHLEAGDFGAFDRDVLAMLALSDEIGHPRHRWRPLLLASARATTLGRFAESDRYVTEVRQLSGMIDDPALAPALLFHDLMRWKTQRRDDEVRGAIPGLERALRGSVQASVMGAVVRASCAARMGDVESTRRELAAIASDPSPISEDLTETAFLGEAYALVGPDTERRRVRKALASARQKEIVGGPLSFTYEGTVQRVVGLLDASLGDLASAETALRAVHDLAVLRGHLPWVAQTAYELAGVIRRAGRDQEARALEKKSETLARDLGMTGLERSLTTAAQPAPSIGDTPALTVQRDGDIWTITRGPSLARIKDSRGMRMLARLLERPGEEIHVLGLASDDGTSAPESHAGELLDDRAKKAYRLRLADLRDDLEEAERQGDQPRIERLAREKQALGDELARATGLGGRGRLAGSATERARVNVQRRVKDAIARIAEVDTELGRFFSRAVSTGTFCCFRP
jgi:hypothetical protein